MLYATLALQGCAGAVGMATDALGTFCAAHAALIDGNEQVPGVFCEELGRVDFGAGGADAVIRDFIALSRAAASTRSPAASAARRRWSTRPRRCSRC